MTLEISRQSGEAVCRLRVEMSAAGVLPRVPQLLEMLERFAAYWASHSETVPALQSRFRSAPPPAIVGRTARPEVSPQRRAA